MAMERSCHDLLIAVLSGSAEPAYLRMLAANVRDWDQSIDLACQHSVLPMLWQRMSDFGPSVPTSAINRIRREYDRIVLHNLANAAELIAVLQRFESEGIDALPFKGVVLAASMYGDLLKRPGGDLDFLIRERDLDQASELILQRGYEPKSPDMNGSVEIPGLHERSFIRRSDGTVLELRWRLDLVWNRYGRNLGMDWAWPHRRITMLSGAQIPDLSPEILLLVLCMHGSKHSWSRLIWVCDVAKILDNSPDLDWNWVLEEARKQGLARSLALGVLLAIRVTGASVPSEILARCEADKTASRLADHFTDHIVQNPGERPPGRLPYGWQLLDRQDRSKQLLSGNFLRPTERDLEVFALPQPLRPLYYLLRPIRLLLDRSAR